MVFVGKEVEQAFRLSPSGVSFSFLSVEKGKALGYNSAKNSSKALRKR